MSPPHNLHPALSELSSTHAYVTSAEEPNDTLAKLTGLLDGAQPGDLDHPKRRIASLTSPGSIRYSAVVDLIPVEE